jgi:hypothetical protein
VRRSSNSATARDESKVRPRRESAKPPVTATASSTTTVVAPIRRGRRAPAKGLKTTKRSLTGGEKLPVGASPVRKAATARLLRWVRKRRIPR